MKKTILIICALSLAGCTTTKQTICAQKAQAIQAAQDIINALNAYCPLEAENANTIEEIAPENTPDTQNVAN